MVMMFSDQTSMWFPCDDTVAEPEAEEQVEKRPEKRTEKKLQHIFISKTVQMHFHPDGL